MAEIKFTQSQQDVIDHIDNNLLVFASAGSGKTAVIIEKIAQSIIKNQTSLDKLLVVTFTESATAEMKQRLNDKLGENIDKPNIRQEIEKLPLADISTLHGFCQKLIKQYFFELDIEPSFTIFSDEESNFYKIKAIDYLLRQEQEESRESFISLCETFYNNRSLVSLKDNVLKFYNFLQSLDNKEEYLDVVATSCYSQDLDNNNACKFIVDRFAKDYKYFKISFDKLKTESEQAGEDKVTAAIEKVTQMLLKKDIALFSEMFDFFKLLKEAKSPFGIKVKSDILDKARVLWSRMTTMLNSFFDICGEKENIDVIADNMLNSVGVVEEFVLLVKKFEQEYTLIKKQKKALDFDDLEKYALELLSNETLCKAVQEKYDVIYIDEYQDINSKQEKILSLVTKGDNMVMVGDLKQSIYGFRNSSPQILINKTLLYKQNIGGNLITLQENFRSNPVILDFVNNIFDKVMKEDFGGIDYKTDGAFKGSAKYQKVKDYKEVSIDLIKVKEREEKETYIGDVYSVANDNREDDAKSVASLEAKVIAEKIKNMHGKPYYDAKKKTFETLDYKNFTILCRSNSYIKELSMHLQKYEIPVSSKTSSNIYENPDILFLLNLLKVVNNPQDDLAIVAVLSSAFFGITFDDLATIRNAFDCEQYYDAINEYIQANSNDLTDKLNKAFAFIGSLRDIKDFSTIYQILVKADRELGIANYYLLLPDGRARHKLISNFIEEFNLFPYNNDINEYLNYVDSYLKGIEKTMQAPTSQNCVNIDTIHSSKGLEYEVVFVAGCGKQFSNISLKQDVLRDKELGVGIHSYDLDEHTKTKTLVKQAIVEKVRLQEKLEETRLLYVALTRAKNSLNIVACLDFKNLDEMTDYDIHKSNKYIQWVSAAFPRPLIENIKDCEQEKTFNYNDHFEVNVHLPESIMKNDREDVEFNFGVSDKKLERDIEQYLSKIYEHQDSFSIAQKNTVTGLMRMEADELESINTTPKKLKVDENNSYDSLDYALLGTIYHKILQEINFDFDNLQEVETFVEKLKNEDKQNQEYYKKINYKKILKCIQTLRPMLKEKWIEKEKQFMAYVPYKDIITDSQIEDKVLLQGIIDLMVGNAENIDIIDYKTTRAEKEDQLVDKYKIQMYLYKIAAERAVGKSVKNVYIYSLYLDKLIKII